MANKRVPDVRFDGFSREWEEKKLIEVAKYRNGKAHEQNIDEQGQYIVINSKFVSTDGEIKKHSKILIEPLEKGEIAFVLSDIPNGRALARTYLIRKSSKYSLNQRIAGITPNECTDSYFLSTLMNRNRYFLKFDSGVGQTNLSKSEVENFNSLYPSYFEQQKIGEFFKQLDDRIALQQRYVEQLKQSKQGFLQKMFPKDGESVPEVRFAGVHGEWIEKEIGHFLQESRMKGSNGLDAKKLTVKLWGKGIVEKNSDFKGSIATQYYKRRAGQFMYGKLDFLHQAFGIVPDYLDGFESTLDSPAFDLSDDINANFLLEYVSREKFYVYLGTIANGSRKAKRIHVDTFLKMPIHVPQFQEQQKIGEFFKQLDDLIAKNERELELLQETKKGFLQKMFV